MSACLASASSPAYKRRSGVRTHLLGADRGGEVRVERPELARLRQRGLQNSTGMNHDGSRDTLLLREAISRRKLDQDRFQRHLMAVPLFLNPGHALGAEHTQDRTSAETSNAETHPGPAATLPHRGECVHRFTPRRSPGGRGRPGRAVAEGSAARSPLRGSPQWMRRACECPCGSW